MANLGEKCRHQLSLFKRQYLQLQAGLKYPDPECLRNEAFQQALYDEIFATGVGVYQLPKRYQMRTLKELVKRIESSIVDWDEEAISDDLMSALSNLLLHPSSPSSVDCAQKRAHVTYTISSLAPSATITILESRQLLAAGGSTGFRTWDASLHLCSYLLAIPPPFTITGRHVLELGAGTGFLSVLCAKYLQAAHVIATDGSTAVLDDLPHNFALNNISKSADLISTQHLPWGKPLPELRAPDIILGADVTYDRCALPALVSTLAQLASRFPAAEILIAATIRNADTWAEFHRISAEHTFVVEEIKWPVPKPEEQMGPFYWEEGIEIRMCRIKMVGGVGIGKLESGDMVMEG